MDEDDGVKLMNIIEQSKGKTWRKQSKQVGHSEKSDLKIPRFCTIYDKDSSNTTYFVRDLVLSPMGVYTAPPQMFRLLSSSETPLARAERERKLSICVDTKSFFQVLDL